MVNKEMKFLDNGDIRYEIVDEAARTGLANKITSPTTSGTEGQVLTIDANGNPKWDNTSSDMSDYYTKSEIYSKTEVDDLINAYQEEISERTISAPPYDSKSTYAVGDYCSKDEAIYKCTEPITTAETWNASHWTVITSNEMIADMNDKLNMLVTSQVVEQPPAPEDVQCVNPADVLSKSTATMMFVRKIDVSRNGIYYGNPYSTASLHYAEFFNEYGEKLTVTDKNGEQISALPSIGGYNTWFTIENHRVLKTFVRNGELANTYTASGDISYLGNSNNVMHNLW